MSERYYRILILLFFLTTASIAQDINDIGTARVNQMKLDGQLTGKEQYTNRNAGAPNLRISAPSPQPQSIPSSCNCWIDRDASFQIGQFDGSGASGGPGLPPDYRNDDWSTTAINLPFDICFYGQQINQVYLNNNGNISIGAAYSTFTANSFPDPTYVMIAPFWADVDTRGPSSGLVYYKVTPTHMIVQWENVGYFASHDDKVNTFQLIVTDGNDPILPPGQNVSFCYKDMQWTTGDASSGVNGFGGVPATVGVNQGNGIDYIQFGLFDTSGSTYDGPYGNYDGVDWLDGQSFTINACVSSANIPPVLNSVNVCDTIRLCENTTYQLTANYLSPEQNQSTTINYFFGGMTGINVLSNTPGNTASIVLEITGQQSNLGFHTISISAIDNGTPSAATNSNFVIEVMPAPLPGFTFSPASPVLANTLINFTNTTSTPGTLFTWDFGDGSPTTTTPNPSHTYATDGVYTVTLSAMFPNGCTTVITQQITVTTCTPAVFTANDICLGETTTITYTGTVSPTATYSWDFDGGTVLSGNGAGPYVISWNTPGQYTVWLEVAEPTCSTNSVLPVNVNAQPIVSMTQVPQLCEGDLFNVSFTGTAGASAAYNWDFGSGTILSGSGSGPYSVQFNTPGNIQLSLVVDDNGCADSTGQLIQINPIPNALFTVPATACAEEPLTVTYTGSASAAATYAWDFSGAVIISGSGQGPYSVNWNTGGNYSVTLTVTENGCTSTPVNMPVAITSIPVVSLTASPALCVGQQGTLSFTGNAGAGAIFTWNFGNATVISGSGPGPYTLEWNSAGTQQVQLTVSENNCSASSQTDVIVNPIPTSDFLINNAACIDNPVSISYNGSASNSATFNWTFSNATILSGSGPGPYSVSWSAAGSYPVTLTVTENGCVSAPTNMQAVVNGLPNVFAGTDQQVCSGVPAGIGTSPVTGESYQWSPVNFLNNASISNPSAVIDNNSNAQQHYTYYLLVTDANGCSNRDTVMVSVQPEPVIGFQKMPGQCLENNFFNFNAFSNVGSGFNYNWTFAGPASVPASSQQSTGVTYSATGTFYVGLTGDYNGCPALPYSDSVTVFEMPVSDFVPLVTEGCEPLTVPFTNLSTGNGNTYQWFFGDGGTGNNQAASHTYSNEGIYSVTLTAMNLHGCAVDTTYLNLITVFDSPHGEFLPNPSVANILSPVIQFQNYSTNVLTYLWDFGDLDTSTAWSPSHVYSDTGNYHITLMLISPDGCIDTVRGIVRVEDNFSFYVPNAFTPNGDGINDSFRGYGVAVKEFVMSIYNRWGELIFSTNNPEQPWDGSVNSDPVQSDVYVYRIVLTDHHGEMHTYIGDVSVLY